MEQAKLREEYIEGYRRSVRHHIEGIKVVDEEGNDVTPENYVKYNVKKVCMAVASMILNHNNDVQGFGIFQALVLKYKILNILYKIDQLFQKMVKYKLC